MVDRDDEMMEERGRDEEETEQKLINEEYKLWKKNAPFLYDMILSTALDWPTLTTQWFPDKKSPPGKNHTLHRLLIGTHTANGAKNYLQIANVQLPTPQKPDMKDYDEETGEIGGYGAGSAQKEKIEVKFNIVQKIDHPGEVNKARYQPQHPDIIATMCTDGRILIFDRSKLPSIPTGNYSPSIELLGHKKEGFGLSWSPHEAGRLATGSEDKTVKLWDITTIIKGTKKLEAAKTYTHHAAIVNDVQYHPIHPAILGTVSDDLTMQIIDLRSSETSKSAVTSGLGQHRDAINAIAFNPYSDVNVATGSADKTIGIWDLRNLRQKVHALEGHKESVTGLQWHPHEESVLASSSYDRRILFWDLAKVGEEQEPEETEDGPPELLFMHGGHTNRISDFSWNPNDPWIMCSAAEDNLIQVWKVADAIVGADDEDVPIEELERP